MSGYSRVSMPQGFYDKTSDMLLVQPEPQYLYALLALAACRADLETPEEMGIPLPDRAIGGAGAQYTAAERDRLMLSNPMVADIFAATVDFNAAPGGTVRINRPSFDSSTATETARRIPTGSSISTTAIAPAAQQVNLTVHRYGGPYDQGNGNVAPYGIEAFDANMGVHKASSLVGTHMKRDYHRFLDAVHVGLFDLASSTLYPEGMSANDDATATGSFPMTFELLARAESNADDANLPTFPDGFRAIVLTPTQLRQLKADPDYIESSESHPQYNVLFPQYVSSVGKLHVFKSTTLTTTANASGIPVHHGHLIAPGAALIGMGRPPRVANSTDDNYGESAKVIWLADHGFGLANDELVISVRSAA
jgi:hypothetical protein